jgi:hypothetical protein
MSRHRSDLTQSHTAFDFDVVSDPPRPFKVRHDIPAEAPSKAPPEAPAEQPAQLTSEQAKPAVSPHSDRRFAFGNP